MQSEERVQEIFKITNVLQEGHFKLSSGRHAGFYLQCAQVLQYPKYTNELATGIAGLWKDYKIDLVIGPAVGGIIIAYAVGQALGCRAIFTERIQGEMTLRRNFKIKPGEKVLIVEDVITTGGSVKEVIKLLGDQNCEIVGISSLVDRSGGKVNFTCPFKPLATISLETYSADYCPYCQKNLPFTKPGSR